MASILAQAQTASPPLSSMGSAATAGPEQEATPINAATDAASHLMVDVHINGNGPYHFVVDTGATMVALTARDAEMLGIHPAASDYTIAVSTANGRSRAAPVTLGKVEIGSITIRDVSAMVMPEDALSENLLGMTFLSRLQRYEYSKGRLVLEK